MAAVRFFESARDAEEEMSKSTYYALLVPVTLPATIAFVYLNWLSASFFKSA
jgi:phosphatidylinositol glycan anchor class Y biosynthesis protein